LILARKDSQWDTIAPGPAGSCRGGQRCEEEALDHGVDLLWHEQSDEVAGAHGLAGHQVRGQLLEAGEVGQRRPGADQQRRHPAGRGGLIPVPDQQMLPPSGQGDVLRKRRQPVDEPRLEIGLVRRQEERVRVLPLRLLVVGASQPGGVLAGLRGEPASRVSRSTTTASRSPCLRVARILLARAPTASLQAGPEASKSGHVTHT
jgi:hypothetical protein